MANLKNSMPQESQTNAQEVRAQNQQSIQGMGGSSNTEFASETNAQEVRQQNATSMAKKNQQNAAQQQNQGNQL